MLVNMTNVHLNATEYALPQLFIIPCGIRFMELSERFVFGAILTLHVAFCVCLSRKPIANYLVN